MRILADIINTEAPDTDYVNGRIRNRNDISGDPGTPVIEELYGDIVQFFQKLLILAEITANDLPDNETNGHQTLEALGKVLQRADFMGFENLAFIQDLVDATNATNGQISVAWINGIDFVVADFDGLQTYRIDGDEIRPVGSLFSISPSVTFASVCKIDTDKIAHVDSNNLVLSTYSWSGTAWSLTGNQLSFASGYDKLTICQVDTDTVAFIDEDTRDLRTYEFDGSDWAQVGNGLNITGISSKLHIAVMNPNDVIAYGWQSDLLRQYRFDGTDWAQIGNSRIMDGTSNDDITAGNGKILFIRDNDFRAYNRILYF